ELERLPVEPRATRRSTRPAWPPGPASVAFTDVWFRYRYPPDGPWAHRGLTCQLPRGGPTAIVGPSGSGKSTIFALLERYYEPKSGSIAIDGRDIRAWPLPELRAAIGYVEQDAPILAGTLRDNLRLASPGATDAALPAALTLPRLQAVLDPPPHRL